MSRAWSISLLAFTFACSDSTEPRSAATFRVTPATQWSGGVVTVTSSSLRAGPAAPVFTADGESLSVSRRNDSTVAITLPSGPSGVVALVRQGAAPDTVGVVQVVGLRAARYVPGWLGYEPLSPSGIVPLVFVAQDLSNANRGLTILDPVTDQVSTVSGVGPIESFYGILPSYLPNRFVLRDSLNQAGVWQLFPTPAFIGFAADQSLTIRHESQLADSVWLSTSHNSWKITRAGDTTTSTQNFITDPLRLAFSPSGDRAALVVNLAGTGRVPVFDGHTGDTVYSVPLPASQGVAFGAGSDQLFVASRSLGGPDSLLAVAASNGLRLAETALPAGYSGWALATDPKNDLLYQVADSSGILELLVFDGATLQLVGRLRCGACGTTEFWSAGVAVDTVTNRIHVAYPGNPIPLITFDRLP